MTKTELGWLGSGGVAVQLAVLLLIQKAACRRFLLLPLLRRRVGQHGPIDGAVQKLIDSREYIVVSPGTGPDNWEGLTILRRGAGKEWSEPVLSLRRDARGEPMVVAGTPLWPLVLFFLISVWLWPEIALAPLAIAIGIALFCVFGASSELARIRLRLLDAFWE